MAVQVPASLKAISSYLKTAQEYDKRDPIVAYFCRLYAMQKGIKLESKGKDSRGFLLEMMDQLEKKKKELSSQGYEAVSDEVVAQLYIDEKALQLFLWADTEDRAAKFSKNVVKSFYTASLLYDVLTQFGELSEEGAHHQKYAKWKAAYIHKCLKNGETPVAGPVGGEDEDTFDQEGGATPYPSSTSNQQPAANTGPPTGFPGAYPPQPYPSNQTPYPSNQTPYPSNQTPYPITPAQPTLHQPSQPSVPPSVPVAADVPVQPSNTTTATLTPQENEQAQKYCRFAASALQYEDVKTAIENLRKALSLLEK